MENSYLNIDYHGISEGSIVAHFKREKKSSRSKAISV